jgi:hypothetical protein
MEIKKKGVGSPVAAQDVTTPFLQEQIVVKERNSWWYYLQNITFAETFFVFIRK